MDKCRLPCLHTTVSRWNGQEVQVLVSMLMEDTTEITISVEQPVLKT